MPKRALNLIFTSARRHLATAFGIFVLPVTLNRHLSLLRDAYAMAFSRLGPAYPLTTVQLLLSFSATLLWLGAALTGKFGAGVPLGVLAALWLLPAVIYWPEALAHARLRARAQAKGAPELLAQPAADTTPRARATWRGLGLGVIIIVVLAWAGMGVGDLSLPLMLAALVALLPSPVLPAINGAVQAGAERLLEQNVIARHPQAVLKAGQVDVLLLDKTGTITNGARAAIAFIPAVGVDPQEMARCAALASLQDATPEGRSIVTFAREQFGTVPTLPPASFAIPFREETRLSGIDLPQEKIRKGAAEAMLRWLGQDASPVLAEQIRAIALKGDTPLLLGRADANGLHLLGVIHLHDSLKSGVKLKIALLERLGVRTVMITGDNPQTAQTIAQRTGIASWLAEATPETKRQRIETERQQGHIIAMCGDGGNDAPALKASDLALVPAHGEPEALAAADMIDRDGRPNKLIEILLLGRQVIAARYACRLFQRGADAARFVLMGALLFGFSGEGWLQEVASGAPEASAVVIAALLVKAAPSLASLGMVLEGVRPRRRRQGASWRQWPWRYAIFGTALTSLSLLIMERVLSMLLAV